MPTVIEHHKYIFVSHGLNSNKWWEILLHDNDDVEVRYGRVGSNPQKKVHIGVGRKKMEALIRSKTTQKDHYDGGCYREVQTLDAPAGSPGKAPAVAAKHELKEIAKKQIATCTITAKLIEFFTEVNAHQIYQATGGRIQYDVSAGTFKTPLGIVTRSNVDAARTILDELTLMINAHKLDKPFVTKLEDYLMLIPQDVGRKFEPIAFCGDVAGVQKQSAILDGLEASIAAVMSSAVSKDGKKKAAKAEPEPELFKTKLAVVSDRAVLDEIQKFYDKGKKQHHVSARLKMQKVYAVDMPHMKEAWERDGAKMQNIWKLWHGTKASNALSLLKLGYVVPPQNASHVCARAFGNGTYFSAESTKSLNYATNYWGGRDEGRYFMFYNLVAMGKFFVPTNTFSGGARPGYDSTYCKPGQVFQNSEMIVYRTSQILPTHLIEFS